MYLKKNLKLKTFKKKKKKKKFLFLMGEVVVIMCLFVYHVELTLWCLRSSKARVGYR